MVATSSLPKRRSLRYSVRACNGNVPRKVRKGREGDKTLCELSGLGVRQTWLDKELAAEYGIDGLTACPMMKAGDVFYADYAKPQGFCDEAWKAIYQYVFALAHGADKSLFYYGDWIKKSGVAIVSCNDGLRPVIMKLEATDEESKIDYEPVAR